MPDVLPLRPADPQRLGRYKLLGRLGSGGQGIVYLARSRSGDAVAIKLLHDHFVGDARARRYFARELEAVQRVDPFCTARVLAADVEGDVPYIVSELIEGPSLQRVVETEGPLAGAALDRLAIGTATALAAIHQAGVVHRDFKPGNVLLGLDGPRVIDFGIARAMDTTGPLTSQVVGTPAYMAPEQLGGERPGPEADVFAWGCTIVYAANGRPPFGEDLIPAVINRILHEEPGLGDLNGSLRELVTGCLDKKSDQRPSAQQVLLQVLGHDEHLGAQLDEAAVLTATLLQEGTSLAGADAPLAVTGAASTVPNDTRRAGTVRMRRSTVPARIGKVVRRLRRLRRRRLLSFGGGIAVVAAVALPLWFFLTGDDGGSFGGQSPGSEGSTGAVRPQKGRLPGTSATLAQDMKDEPVALSSYQTRVAASGVPAGTVYLANPQNGSLGKSSYEVVATSRDGWRVAARPDAKKRLLLLLERVSGQSHNVEMPTEFTSPQWSPNAGQLLLTAQNGSGAANTGFVIIDTDSWEPRVVRVSGRNVGAFWWNGDGTGVVTNVGSAGDNKVRFYDLDGKKTAELSGTFNGPLKGGDSGAFSPSGERFTAGCAPAAPQICVWDAASGKAVARVPVPAGGALLGWYDDGHLILQRQRDCVVVDLKGKTTRTLVKSDSGLGMPGLSFTYTVS